MSHQDNNPPKPQNAPERQPGKSSPPEPLPPANVGAQTPSTPSLSPRDTLFVERPQAKAGITCPKCGHVNRPGVLVCESCGTLLVEGDQAVSTKRFEGDKQDSDLRPTSMETAELVSMAVSTAGSTQFSENMILRLEIEGAPTPILLSPKFETSIGRRDPATGTLPDVDLSAYAGYRLGVSRKHAIIRMKNRQLEIYDLGSSNGTSVNGVRLTPHEPHTLRDGDEITLGKMSVRVLFQARNRRK